jgi:hypothetical protein
MKKTSNVIPILFALILIVLFILTGLSYLMMTVEDKAKFPFEIGKFLMQLIVIIIIGGGIQFIFTLLKSQQEERLSESYYSRQLEKGKKLLNSGIIQNEEKALFLLTKLSYDFKYRRQDIINVICDYLRKTFSQVKTFDVGRTSLLDFSIKSLAEIPRNDENNHILCIDIHQIKVESINLFGINLNNFVMWGCQFTQVILSRGSFENADLSGVIFNNCGMEFCNLKNSLIAVSPLDKRNTSFLGSQLYHTNLHESNLVSCELQKIDDFDIESVKDYIVSGKIKLI